MDIAARVKRRLTTPRQSQDVEPTGGERPQAVYARVLDGDTLWLAVTQVGGPDSRLALRHRETGELVPVPAEVVLEGDGVLLSARFDLTRADSGLPASGRVAYVVVVVEPDLAEPVRVFSTPVRTDGPTRVPTSRDGRWQFRVNAVDGGLRLIREPRKRPATAASFAKNDTTMDLWLSVPEGVDPTLLVMTREETVLRSLPLSRDEELFTASLGDDDLPEELRLAPLAVGTPDSWLPVLRRSNDLRFPQAAVALPELHGDAATDTPTIRLRFLATGQLALARPPVGGADDDSDDDEPETETETGTETGNATGRDA